MPRLILLLAVIAVAYLLLRRARSLPPHLRRAEYVKLGLGLTLIIAVGLALTGRMHWLGAALTGLLVILRQSLPLLIRYVPMLASLRRQKAGAGKQRSTVESAILRMHLDHDSGQLDGEVLQGAFKDWRLADMDRAQLESLLAYCREQDSDSAQLLESYLQQRFPGEGSFNTRSGAGTEDAAGAGMGRKEALAILGLQDGASDEEIVAAHRKLMQKLHPDRGGSDYLAAKVNRAKDILLGSG
ncbi:MAG: DnaJ domain-containing protein [Halioglobus sp.]